MSSALRTVSQIEPTVKFLRGLGVGRTCTPAQMDTFLAAATTRTTQSTNGINTVALSSEATPIAGSANSDTALYRDLGRRVTIASGAAGNAHRQVWIQVQLVSGATTEGVPLTGGDTLWIRTFIDDGTATGFARLG